MTHDFMWRNVCYLLLHNKLSPKLNSLKQQTFVISQFLWIKSSGLASPGNSGSAYCSHNLRQGYGHQNICRELEDTVTSGSLVAASRRCWFLASHPQTCLLPTLTSPQGCLGTLTTQQPTSPQWSDSKEEATPPLITCSQKLHYQFHQFLFLRTESLSLAYTQRWKLGSSSWMKSGQRTFGHILTGFLIQIVTRSLSWIH